MVWNRSQRLLKKAATDVYRIYDAEGHLLYVGASVNVFKRMREHKRYAEWWEMAATARVVQYPDRTSARHVEALAIRDERPVFNVTIEQAELRRAVEIQEPIEVLHLRWEKGEVFVDGTG